MESIENLRRLKGFKALSIRRQLYLINYLTDPRRSQVNAALKTGYPKASAKVSASKLMKDIEIKRIIAKFDEFENSKFSDLREKVVKELSLIAFSNIKEFLSWSEVAGVKVKDSEKLKAELTRVISEISETPTAFGNSKKLKLHDKIAALRELNKMHGFYAAEKLDLNNPDGNLTPIITVTMPSNGREKKE